LKVPVFITTLFIGSIMFLNIPIPLFIIMGLIVAIPWICYFIIASVLFGKVKTTYNEHTKKISIKEDLSKFDLAASMPHEIAHYLFPKNLYIPTAVSALRLLEEGFIDVSKQVKAIVRKTPVDRIENVLLGDARAGTHNGASLLEKAQSLLYSAININEPHSYYSAGYKIGQAVFLLADRDFERAYRIIASMGMGKTLEEAFILEAPYNLKVDLDKVRSRLRELSMAKGYIAVYPDNSRDIKVCYIDLGSELNKMTSEEKKNFFMLLKSFGLKVRVFTDNYDAALDLQKETTSGLLDLIVYTGGVFLGGKETVLGESGVRIDMFPGSKVDYLGALGQQEKIMVIADKNHDFTKLGSQAVHIGVLGDVSPKDDEWINWVTEDVSSLPDYYLSSLKHLDVLKELLAKELKLDQGSANKVMKGSLFNTLNMYVPIFFELSKVFGLLKIFFANRNAKALEIVSSDTLSEVSYDSKALVLSIKEEAGRLHNELFALAEKLENKIDLLGKKVNEEDVLSEDILSEIIILIDRISELSEPDHSEAGSKTKNTVIEYAMNKELRDALLEFKICIDEIKNIDTVAFASEELRFIKNHKYIELLKEYIGHLSKLSVTPLDENGSLDMSKDALGSIRHVIPKEEWDEMRNWLKGRGSNIFTMPLIYSLWDYKIETFNANPWVYAALIGLGGVIAIGFMVKSSIERKFIKVPEIFKKLVDAGYIRAYWEDKSGIMAELLVVIFRSGIVFGSFIFALTHPNLIQSMIAGKAIPLSIEEIYVFAYDLITGMAIQLSTVLIHVFAHILAALKFYTKNKKNNIKMPNETIELKKERIKVLQAPIIPHVGLIVLSMIIAMPKFLFGYSMNMLEAILLATGCSHVLELMGSFMGKDSTDGSAIKEIKAEIAALKNVSQKSTYNMYYKIKTLLFPGGNGHLVEVNSYDSDREGATLEEELTQIRTVVRTTDTQI
jgi:hypothetical protein